MGCESTGKCRANLATSESHLLICRTLCGFSLSYNVTSAKECFSPLLLGQQTTQSLSQMACNMKLTCRCSGNKNHSWCNVTRQISNDSHMQEQIQTVKHFFCLCPLYLCFIVCTLPCNSSLPSRNHQSIYQADWLSVKWLVHIGIVNLFKDT